MRPIFLIAGLAASFFAGLGAGALKWRGNAEHWHRDGRIQAILAHASQMQAGGVLVIGDSITEQVRFDRLCGLPALNAGIARSTSKDWLPDAARVIAAARPSTVILALGTNDAGDWHDAYRQLARRASFAVEPADPAKATFVRSVVRTVPGITSTLDGIHPDAEGARQWLEHVERGCQAARAATTGVRAS